MKLPFFPLQTIFFPGETVPLHIVEDRYKQLIGDCKNDAITFGIPVYIHNSIAYGTEVQLVEVVSTYEEGEMDVVCIARQVFKILTFNNVMEGKQYAGGVVQFVESVNDADESLKAEVLEKINVLYDLMSVPYTSLTVEKFNSYILAHKMGLSFEQEYELLRLSRESERLTFIKTHLETTITVLKEVGRTKKTIELNGAFRNFDPLDFEGFKI
ncbi:MAG: ATP-dependent protease [Maribacter sp.]|nr:MAG: ATP-dependent protease [Maribacter sp.]